MKKIYLPGLNGLRAIAASSVILSHIFNNFPTYGLPRLTFFSYFATYGVTIFFALSGFLITYLLLKEVDKTQTISVKKFYIRRILRIWPLYFSVIFLVLILMRFNVDFNILFYLFILPNIPFAKIGLSGSIHNIPLLAHYWSLGVEEQFYAFWPCVVKYIKNLKLFLFLFCIGFIVLKFALKLLKMPDEIISFVYYTRFSCLIIGGIGAYYFHKENDFLKLLNHKIIEITSWIVLLLLMLDVLHVFSIIAHEIVSVITLVIIFNQVNNAKPLLSLENKVFDYLGKISFGLYIYNPIVIYLLSFYLTKLEIGNPVLKTLLIVTINFTVIIAVSHISFFYFEKLFLNIKHRFTTVESLASNPKND